MSLRDWLANDRVMLQDRKRFGRFVVSRVADPLALPLGNVCPFGQALRSVIDLAHCDVDQVWFVCCREATNLDFQSSGSKLQFNIPACPY